MKAVLLVTLVCIAPQFGTARRSGSIAAVQKVVDMLTSMSVAAKKEKTDEQIAYAAFEQWCTDENARLKKSISKAQEKLNIQRAEVERLEGEAEALQKEIEDLHARADQAKADMKSKTALRKKENAAFLEESGSFSESVDAIDRALVVLQTQYAKTSRIRGTPDALIQLSDLPSIPADTKSIISSFIGMMKDDGDSEMDYQPPEANAYEFQSSNLITILKRLQDEFREKLAESQKAEMNSKQAYEMIIQDLTDLVENAETDASNRNAEKQRKLEKSGALKKDNAMVEKAMADDEKTLAQLEQSCHEKKLSFEEKQELRMDELEAISKAIEILQSKEVMGTAEAHLDLAQMKQASSFVQAGEESPRHKVRDYLAGEARRLRSKGLGLLVEKMSADPFAKVKKMIDQMITRLLNEANEDANHEGFCDKEMGQSKVTRNKLGEDIDRLTAAIDDGKSTIMSLAEDLKTLAAEIANLDTLMKEATEQRVAEKKKNEATIAEAADAKKAVAAAIAILKDFYEKASVATALVQGKAAPDFAARSTTRNGWSRGVKFGSEEWKALANPEYTPGEATDSTYSGDVGHKEGMQTFGDTYQGQADSAGGVLALLDSIGADFANLKTDTEGAEAASQKAYDDLMTESKKNKEVKQKQTEMNTQDKSAAETKLEEDITDLKATQRKLFFADKYHERLVPQCIDQGVTFEGRQKARQDEIESLKTALKILSNEDIETTS